MLWFDRHDFIRNMLGFWVIALVGLGACSRGVWLLVALGVLAFAIEIIQLWVPHRGCELHDVVSRWLGIVLAWILLRRLQKGKEGKANWWSNKICKYLICVFTASGRW
jgi:glycopeptide antibiotics resistance protein